MTDKYQTLVLTFSNGRKGYFVGRAIVDKEDEITGLKIVNTAFTDPKPLPPDCTFGPMIDGKDEADND